MTDLVPADRIEQIVGARRHALAHLGRAVSAERTVYILHSAACRASGIDLRACAYSRALDNGIDGLHEWDGQHDRVVTLQAAHGCLIPDDDGPTDIEYVSRAQARRCPVHHLPRTPDTWMAACTCPSTSHGIEEAD